MPTLGDLMQHPALYAAYPQIKNTPVRMLDVGVFPNGKRAALASDGAVEIASRADPEELRCALLGVMQLIVNRIEGFSE